MQEIMSINAKLQELKTEEKRISETRDELIGTTIRLMQNWIDELGISADSLRFPSNPAPNKRGNRREIRTLYRDPENPSHTWNGHGKRPEWFKNALEKGFTRERLAL